MTPPAIQGSVQSGTTNLVSLPAGWSAGEVCLLTIICTPFDGDPGHSDWTLIKRQADSDSRLQVNAFYRVLQAGDTTWAFSSSGGFTIREWATVRFPASTTFSTPTGAGDAFGATTLVLPAVTATDDDTLIAIAGGREGGSTACTGPGGMTKEYQEPSSGATAASPWTALFTESIATGGSTGTRTMTWTYGNDRWAGVMVAASGPPPTQTVDPDGVATSEAVGVPQVNLRIKPGSVPSAEAFGAARLNLTIDPAGIGSAESFGSPVVVQATYIAPAGIASAEAFGSLRIGEELLPGGIASAETIGTPAVIPGVVTVHVTSITSAEDVGDVATIVLDAAPSSEMLLFELTTRHKPSGDGHVLCEIRQYTEGEVNIPWMDARTAKVTFSIYDDALATVDDALGGDLRKLAYQLMLRAWYRGRLVFWGPITVPDWQGAAGTVTLNAVDPSLQLENHFLRIGDDALAQVYDPRTDGMVDSNGRQGDITLDYRGLLTVMHAADNTDAQNDRDMPQPGIVEGDNTADTNDRRMRVQRGDQAWDTMKTLANHEDSCEFELRPTPDVEGAYVRLNTFPPHGMGTDRTSDLFWEFGFGQDNLSDFQWQPGGKIITHQTAIDDDKKVRVTKADIDASGDTGAYVAWEDSGAQYGNASADTIEEALGAWARAQVEAYGRPPNFVSVTLKPEAGRYLDDFDQGDLITVRARRGHMHVDIDGRITGIRLAKADDTGRAAATLEIVPDVAAETGDEDA